MLILASLVLLAAGVYYWVQQRGTDQEQPAEEKVDLVYVEDDYWQQLLLTMQEVDKLENSTTEVRALQEYQKDVEALWKAKPGKIVLMLLGEFSAGKSSFVNALLEDDVLTTKVRPTTAAVTILSYGEEEKAVVHEAGGHVRIIPLDAQRQDIAQMTAMGKHQENAENLQQIEYVELFLHCELLKEMDIIDTPGFNSGYEWHTISTRKFLQKADVILWMFHAAKAGTRTEYELLQQTDNQHKLAIVNQIDRIDQVDREDAYVHIRGEIPLELFEQVFFVSSKKPKEGESKADYERIRDIRQYFAQEIAPQKKNYVADHKKQFLKSLQQMAQKAVWSLEQDCNRRQSEILSLMGKWNDLMQQRAACVDAMNYYQRYKQRPEMLLQHLEKILVPEFRVPEIVSVALTLRQEMERLYQEKQQIISLERIIAKQHQICDDCVAKYQPMKDKYDDSFFSNIADSVWNFVANSNFTDSKDELDKAERKMQEAQRLLQQAKQKAKEARQRYGSGKMGFDDSCSSFAQIVNEQAVRQQQFLELCQRESDSLKRQREQQKLELQRHEKMLRVVHNVQQATESTAACYAIQKQEDKALVTA